MALLRSGEGGHIPAYENERLDNGLGQKVSAEDRARIWQWMIRADLKDLGGEQAYRLLAKCGAAVTKQQHARDCHAGTVLHLLAHTLYVAV